MRDFVLMMKGILLQYQVTVEASIKRSGLSRESERLLREINQSLVETNSLMRFYEGEEDDGS